MKKNLQLTPEWVFEKLPHSRCADVSGNISVYTGNATDANWIELALDSLNISYKSYDYLNDHDDFVFGFDFRIEDIRDDCPSLFQIMNKLSIENEFYKNLLKTKYNEK